MLSFVIKPKRGFPGDAYETFVKVFVSVLLQSDGVVKKTKEQGIKNRVFHC